MGVNCPIMDGIGSITQPTRIGVLVIKGFALMSYASTVEPFRAANLLSGKTLYEIINIGETSGMVSSSGAAGVVVEAIVGQDLTLDLLFVVAGGDPASFSNNKTKAWLGRMARSGITLGGVSGGPLPRRPRPPRNHTTGSPWDR